MRVTLACCYFILVASNVSSFAPSGSVGKRPAVVTTIFSEPEEEETGGMDLNLEEMFDM